MTGPQSSPPALAWRLRAAMFTRLFAIQGSWNYESMLGNGIGFAAEPALRALPGGRGGAAYRLALARESDYFNAHPYLASVAVGALVRAELDGQPPAQIERFRNAMCGPLGSLGDRLVWAGWLPLTALIALLAYGLGAGPFTVVLMFLALYNVGHVGLRAWGIHNGWHGGLHVAAVLGHPVLRQAPLYIGRAVLFLLGAVLPLVIRRVLVSTAGVPNVAASGFPGGITAAIAALVGAAVLGGIFVRLHGRVEGWRAAIVVLAALILYSLAR